MKKQFLLLTLFSISLASAFAQQQSAEELAYDHAQNARDEARELWGKKNPSPQDLQKSISILQNDIHFLDSIPVKELSTGNIYLNARKQDVYRDMVSAYLKSNRYEEALNALDKRCAEGSSYGVSELEKDSIYIPIRSNPRFIAVLNKLKNRESLWQDKAFNTPMRENLSDEEKVAGLSQLWSQAKFNFVHFDHANLDWDKTYLDYLSKIKETKSTFEYYKVLQKFYAELKDGHTNVYPPKELSKEFYSRPPIRAELVQGRVMITQVYSDSLKAEGIFPGLEIIKIDTEPVIAYAHKNVAPYQSSSTPQDMEVREFSYSLLSGPEKKPIALELRNAKGKVWTKILTRTGYRNLKYAPEWDYQEINNIGYLVVNNFENSKFTKVYDSLFTRIAKTRGLIIDVRDNGGGSSWIGYHMITTFVNKPFKGSAYNMPRYISPSFGMQWNEYAAGDVSPSGKMLYDKPVIVLVSARTFSAAEDFVVAFDYSKRGKIIGQPTGGSTGQPQSFNLPGGGSARVCGKHDTYADGKEFVGVGIKPDIIIEKTVADVQNGIDAVKNKALALLNQ